MFCQKESDILFAIDAVTKQIEKHNKDSILRSAALYLGLSIGNLISMFNPQRVVLGGSLINHGGAGFINRIVESVHAYTSQDLVVDVRPWALGRWAGSLGAALLVLDQKLDLATV